MAKDYWGTSVNDVVAEIMRDLFLLIGQENGVSVVHNDTC